ncbi:MAG: thiol peroxidase [Kiritimatiellia bacterium]|jgi:thioredoxin-dependent peroxiredoxin
MASITLKGAPFSTGGELPGKGSAAPDFDLTGGNLSSVSLGDFEGKTLILNIFPSLDTGTCQASARRFNQEADKLENTVIANVSMDLPFATDRFCTSEGLESVVNLSGFRSKSFGSDYGVTIVDGPLAGLYSRAVVIIDNTGKIIYTQQVPEIADEPDYDSALNALPQA